MWVDSSCPRPSLACFFQSRGDYIRKSETPVRVQTATAGFSYPSDRLLDQSSLGFPLVHDRAEPVSEELSASGGEFAPTHCWSPVILEVGTEEPRLIKLNAGNLYQKLFIDLRDFRLTDSQLLYHILILSQKRSDR